MKIYILILFIIGNTALSFGAEGIFKGEPLPSSAQELYDQSKTFLTTLDSLIGDFIKAQEDFFKVYENNGLTNEENNSRDLDNRDNIQLVPAASAQNDYSRHYITTHLLRESDIPEEKWPANLSIAGIDFSSLKENFSTLVAHVEAIKPKPSGCLPYYLTFNYFWQKFKFSSNLSTIKTDLKKLFPTVFSTVKVGDASFTTTTDSQYGEQSKPIVYFTPYSVSRGEDKFSITLPLIPDYAVDSVNDLRDLFSWTGLPYGGSTLVKEETMTDGTVVEILKGETYSGQGALSFKQLPGAKYYTLQASYSFDNTSEFSFNKTYNRSLILKGDPTTVFVARSKLLEFITTQIAR